MITFKDFCIKLYLENAKDKTSKQMNVFERIGYHLDTNNKYSICNDEYINSLSENRIERYMTLFDTIHNHQDMGLLDALQNSGIMHVISNEPVYGSSIISIIDACKNDYYRFGDALPLYKYYTNEFYVKVSDQYYIRRRKEYVYLIPKK